MAQHDDKEAERLNRELSKYAALDETEIDQTIQELLTAPKGQKFIWWLLQVGKVGIQPFSTERSVTDFQCGELNVGQQILARLIDVNPLGFAQLQLNRKNDDEHRRAAAKRISTGDDLYADVSGPDSGDSGS